MEVTWKETNIFMRVNSQTLGGKPFLLLLLTCSCSHHGRFSISSTVCHCCVWQQREDWQPLQNMTNMRQWEWDAYSPRAPSSHAPPHGFWPNPNPQLWDGVALGWTPHTGCCLSQNIQQASVTKKGTNIIHICTPAPVSWQLVVKDWAGLNVGEACWWQGWKTEVS